MSLFLSIFMLFIWYVCIYEWLAGILARYKANLVERGTGATQHKTSAISTEISDLVMEQAAILCDGSFDDILFADVVLEFWKRYNEMKQNSSCCRQVRT